MTAENIGNSMDHFKTEAKTDSRERHRRRLRLLLRTNSRVKRCSTRTMRPAANSPLLRELRAELDRQAKDAVLAAAEQAREEVLQTAAATARERTSSAEELFAKWKSEIEKDAGRSARGIFRASGCEAG